MAMPIREVLLLHHSHYDLGYTHPQPVVAELHRRFIEQAVDWCEATADWPDASRPRWTCEVTAPLLAWLDHAGAAERVRFRALVAAGAMSAGALASNLTPLCDAGDLARNLADIRHLRRELALPLTVAIAHDVNGLPWPTTQLLLDAGIALLVMGVNTYNGRAVDRRPSLFRWRGSDGRELRVVNGEAYGQFQRVVRVADTTPLGEAADALRRHLDGVVAAGWRHDVAFLTATHASKGDNSTPNPALGRFVRRWNEAGLQPAIRFCTPETLLARVDAIPAADLPVLTGDWTDHWNFGCGSTARETRIARHARRRLRASGLLRAATMCDRSPWVRRSAEDDLQRFHEHTWGAGFAFAPRDDQAVSQARLKAGCAYTAGSLAAMLLRDQLEAAAGNPVDADGLGSVLFFNSAPVARRATARLPDARWLQGRWMHVANLVHALPLEEDLGESTGVVVGPVDLPANGWRIVPVDELRPAPPDPAVLVERDAIESPTHLLVFAPDDGRILHLIDKRLDWDLVDATSPWPWFGFVHESVAAAPSGSGDAVAGLAAAEGLAGVDPALLGRERFYGAVWQPTMEAAPWDPAWPALRRGPTRLISCTTEHTAEGGTLVLRFDAPGVDGLEQRITLSGADDAIVCEARFDKRDDGRPEAIHLAFPFALAKGWRARYDTAAIPVELDAEQLPGASRDWITVDGWIALHDGEHGVTVACPDAPLVQPGGFGFARGSTSIARDANPLLLGWPMNNYWATNFPRSQPGVCRVRYVVASGRAYDPETAAVLAARARSPITCHPVVTRRSEARSLIEVDGDGVLLIGAEPAEEGDLIVVRLVNVGDQESRATIGMPGRRIVAAWSLSTLDEQRDALPCGDGRTGIALPSRAVRAIGLRLEP